MYMTEKEKNNLTDSPGRLYLISGYIFPIEWKSHHGKKIVFVDLMTTFCISVQNANQGTFEFQKILFREQIPKSND